MNNKYITKVNKFCSKFNIKFYFEEIGEDYKTINWKLTLTKDEFNKIYELKYINDNVVQDLIKDYINNYYEIKLRTD